MTKVQILSTCPICLGQAYLEVGEAEDLNGDKYIRGLPCYLCEGSGVAPKWGPIQDFIALLPLSQCLHMKTSFIGSYRFTEVDVWDDITEECDDCGDNLESKPFYDIP